MLVWLDDLRDPLDYGLDYSIDVRWHKTYSEFKDWMTTFSHLVEEIHLDHDLGDDLDGTGHDALLLIDEKLYFGKLDSLKTIYIHTSNPSAAQKMVSVKNIFKEKYDVDVVRNNY